MDAIFKFDPPIETLGELISRLEDIRDAHPNPTEDPRQIRVVTTFNGRVKQVTVSQP